MSRIARFMSRLGHALAPGGRAGQPAAPSGGPPAGTAGEPPPASTARSTGALKVESRRRRFWLFGRRPAMTAHAAPPATARRASAPQASLSGEPAVLPAEAPPAPTKKLLDNAFVSLKLILEKDWGTEKRQLEQALVGDDMGAINKLLYEGRLRHFPLAPKAVLKMAEVAPEVMQSEAFREALAVARGPAAGDAPALPNSYDPRFNPAVSLHAHYKKRLEERKTQHRHAQAGGMKPSSRSLEDLRELVSLNEKWVVLHDTMAAVDEGLDAARELRDALERYRRSLSREGAGEGGAPPPVPVPPAR
ncbi:hypothetical protein [Noviherbaspirillum aridicola]|uniref:Uncharacterized protein n=1 Tax=Noviherbaspirillum aridicola TaxID=2849687 RepID=A0ABQ4Q5E6_9BURK|nr:hypothetical protein [Noviherbaspirillum aridicola]GIZ52025.1 hypothetical protein NCCP691_20390 [Noviherbaspirillum aridicola]